MKNGINFIVLGLSTLNSAFNFSENNHEFQIFSFFPIIQAMSAIFLVSENIFYKSLKFNKFLAYLNDKLLKFNTAIFTL